LSSIPLGFVDANVLANAIIVENELRQIRANSLKRMTRPSKVDKRREEFFRGYEIGRPAYDLFHMLHQPMTPAPDVVTSNLAKLEVASVIAAEFKARELYRRHVPYRYWYRSQDTIKLTREDLKEIQLSILLFLKKMGNAIVTMNEYNLELAERLITEFACDTRDAILVATAVASGYPLFITEDERLQRKLRQFREVSVVKTQSAVDSLRSYHHQPSSTSPSPES